jgi:hypothetical protein
MDLTVVGRAAVALSPKDVSKLFGDVPAFMGVDHLSIMAVAEPADAVVLGMPYDGIATFRGSN